MSETLSRFNALPRDEAEAQLITCCGSRAWASEIAARRPYADLRSLMETADTVWSGLTPTDWLEAFAAHPRLGESGGHAPGSSQKEQSRVMAAGDQTLSELAAENLLYEARFGHVFLFSAAGRTASEALVALRQRMHNERSREIEVAAEEQRKITRLRLESMLHA